MRKMPGLTRWLWWFGLGAALIVLFKVSTELTWVFRSVGALFDILAPFIGGFALAFFLYAPCNWVENQLLRLKGKAWPKLARPLSLAIVYLLLVGAVALLIYLVIPTLITNLSDLVKSLPTYISGAKERLEYWAGTDGVIAGLNIQETLDKGYQAMMELVNKLLTTENMMSALRGVIAATTSLVDVVLSFIVSVYMLSGRERLLKETGQVLSLFVKPRRLARMKYYGGRIGTIFYKYFYGAFMDAILVGIVASVGLLILRVPYAVALGMLMGLMNMIPYFGAIIAGVMIVLLTLLSRNVYSALIVAIFLIVIQQIDGNLIQPRVVGGSVGLRPIYVLLSVTLFGGLWGFWGIFLGVPLMAVVQLFVKEAIAAKNEATEATPPASD